ncbi:uncharacterized protein JCM10292_000847 [Rhodotorula paludigena]|uniref:uncharacterized protein n=1 Tax=Rhodotorula paludigena TaxID=86838 RepID=UPI00316DDDAA
MCCSNAKWKREVVPDHKFDFIDVHQFHSRTFGSRLAYGWKWTLFIVAVAVYIADTYTLIALLASNRWAGQILQSEAAQSDSKSSNVLEVPFKIGKWIFFGCIVFSYLLLLWEARKARAIVKSRDISYAFTNVMSHNWYALRSYDHFCFFSQIDNSKKKKDNLAFFVFFTFKGWKRLLLADAPRQVINAITLWSFGKSQRWTTDFSVYFSGSLVKQLALVTMLFTVAIFIISALQLLVAAAMYVPLLCYIQGNLKEYCCHKVDKRIAELMKRKNRRRLAKEAEIARREAAGDFRHLKDKSGKIVGAPRPQPTLPKIGLNDPDLYSDAGSVRGGAPPSEKGAGGPGGYAYPPTVPYGNSVPYGLAHSHSYNDSESLSGVAGPYGPGHNPYADSVTSVDAFAAHGQPMGYADSTSTLPLPGQHYSRAPSYRTNPSTRDLHDPPPPAADDSPQHFGELDFDPRHARAGAATPALTGLNGSLASRTGAGAPVDYAPPSRQNLYERAARHNAVEAQQSGESYRLGSDDYGYGAPAAAATSAAYARGAGAKSGSYGGGGYGGWEESGPATAYYADERAPSRGMYRTPSDASSARGGTGNGGGGLAGRGAYGGYR